MLAVLVELNRMDSGEKLSEMRLNDCWVSGLSEDLQQVIIADKVETRKG